MVSQWNSHEWSLEVKPYSAFTAAFDPQIASSAEAPTRILGTELLAAHVKFGCMTFLELLCGTHPNKSSVIDIEPTSIHRFSI